jgi:release factor glutamine methyltransferase
MKPTPSLTQRIKQIAEQLSPIYQPAEEHAWWLLEHITGQPRTALITQNTLMLTPEQEVQLAHTLDLLINQHMPIQYILQSVPFADLDILVEPPTLIPRPETEELCMEIIAQLNQLKNKAITILDLCTGSGCIALALAKAFPMARVYGVDIALKAVALAQKNALHNAITNVQFFHSDLFSEIPSSTHFDLIISNPPYISHEEWQRLDPYVQEWEDPQALIAPNNGLAIIEAIIALAPHYIARNTELSSRNIPQLVLEIGYNQGAAVYQLFESYHFSNIHIKKDLEGKDRFASGSVGNETERITRQ